MAQTDTHTHTTDTNCNLETESAQWADSMKIFLVKSQCFACTFFLNPWLGRPAGGTDIVLITNKNNIIFSFIGPNY